MSDLDYDPQKERTNPFFDLVAEIRAYPPGPFSLNYGPLFGAGVGLFEILEKGRPPMADPNPEDTAEIVGALRQTRDRIDRMIRDIEKEAESAGH